MHEKLVKAIDLLNEVQQDLTENEYEPSANVEDARQSLYSALVEAGKIEAQS